MTQVAELLRRARARLGASQRTVAQKLGISNPSVNAWETGKTLPTPARLGEVCAAYELSDDERHRLAEALGILRGVAA